MTIVVGIDFSKHSRTALDWAVLQAQKAGEGVVLVHAFASRKRSRGSQDPLSEVEAELDVDEAIQLSQDWAEVARSEGVEVDTVAESDDPAQLLLATAKARDASRIVIGTRGRGFLRRALLGSVAEDVVRGADRPIVVVPLARKK